MLVWWDWRTPADQPSEIPKAFTTVRAPDGRANPLRRAKVPKIALDQAPPDVRKLGSPTKRVPNEQPSLPTPEEIEEILAIQDFDTFNRELDSIHGSVHVWIGGHMYEPAFSAYDPIFWAHHAMIDRLWSMWQNRHGRVGPPEEIWDESLQPFAMSVKRVLKINRLGYDYAARTVSRRVAA